MSPEPDRARIRSFLALEIPEALSARISAWQQEEALDPALRAVPEANLHITLAFLGSLEREALAEVEAILASLQPRPIELGLDPEPAPLPPRRPRIFVLDCPSEAAVELQAELARELAAAGLYAPEKRPYRPHITVFRVRAAGRGSRRPARVERAPGSLSTGRGRVGGHTFGSVRAALYRSDLRPEGAIYSRLAAVDLPQAGGQQAERHAESEEVNRNGS